MASIAKSRIQNANARMVDNVQLVASRTKLRISLFECSGPTDKEQIAWMRRIIQDAKTSVPELEDIIIFGPDGQFLVSASGVSHNAATGNEKSDSVSVEPVPVEGTVGAIATKALFLNDKHIGWLRVV